MSNKKVFPDGSSLEWVDKETLRYLEGDSSVLVWVDFEPGLFSNGRIIKTSSITTWNSRPANSTLTISESEKKNIIDKIQQYYKSLNKKCRVE